MTGFRPDHGGSPTQGQTSRPTFRRVRAYYVLKKAEAEAKPIRPTRPLTGMDAALEEYRHFKAAGMLTAWRERWKNVLRPPSLE